MQHLARSLIVLLLLAGSAGAAQFGPETFTVMTGKPVTITKSFPGTAGARLAMQLRGGAGDKQVATGTVVLNGAVVFSPSDFNQQVVELQREVVLAHENQITFTFGGPPGSSVTLSLGAATPPAEQGLSISFDPLPNGPLDGMTVTTETLTVSGTLAGGDLSDVGVVVNGRPALVQDRRFIANAVPLAPGANTVRAVLTNAAGWTAETSALVTSAPTEAEVAIKPLSAAGLAPFNVTFATSVAITAGSQSQSVTCSGLTSTTMTPIEPDRFGGTLNEPGLYLCTFEVTDGAGNIHRSHAGVNVYDRAVLDVLLQGKWQGMKVALTAGNIETALNYVVASRKEDYRSVFTKLSGQFADIFATHKSFTIERAEDYQILYENIVIEEDMAFSYPVRFVPDDDGRLKIAQF